MSVVEVEPHAASGDAGRVFHQCHQNISDADILGVIPMHIIHHRLAIGVSYMLIS